MNETDKAVIYYYDTVEDLILSHIKVADAEAARAWNTARQALEFDELRGYALEGLTQAANTWFKHCHKKNYSADAIEFFKPYSQRRIHGNIYDNLRKLDWAGRTRRTLAKQIQQADQGMGLSESILAEKTGLSVKKVHYIVGEMAQKPISFESGIADVYEPMVADVSSTTEANRILSIAVDAIRKCTIEQQIVLSLHYHEEMDLQDVAKEMGIPEQQASRLHTAAVMAVYETSKLFAEESQY